MKLSVVIITFNEEPNLARTLKSVAPLVANGLGEVIVLDSGSTDRTREMARGFGAKVFVEDWKGYAAQKNSAIAKASGEWILSLDADEEISDTLAEELLRGSEARPSQWCLAPVSNDMSVKSQELSSIPIAYFIPRRNLFLNRWIKHGGFYPDRKLRLFRRGAGQFEERAVHETVKVNGPTGTLTGALIHHAYPTLSGYIEHMNRYSSLGAQIAIEQRQAVKSLFAFWWNVVLRPWLTFLYNYILRLGFLDGREGLLLHLYHATYVSWKYAKAWELSRPSSRKHPDTGK